MNDSFPVDDLRSVALTSGATNGTADHVPVVINWKYSFDGGRAGLYKASEITVRVTPPSILPVTGVNLNVVEHHVSLGVVEKSLDLAMQASGSGFVVAFDWESTVNNPDQELTVTLMTSDQYSPQVILKDPISRRFNFLISLSS